VTQSSALYLGKVVHRRMRPRTHRLSYAIFWMLLDLDEASALDRKLRLFSYGRFNLFTFSDRDHGEGGSSLRQFLMTRLAEAGIDLTGGSVRILCCPRTLGHVFNPISVYFCYDADGILLATLYEVNNTFGDRHTYVLPISRDDRGQIVQKCDKALHVSPFLGMDMQYRFSVLPPADEVAIGIEARDPGGTVLTASFAGRRIELSDASLLRAFLRYPMVTLKIVAGIHWEAFLLWSKGIRVFRRPAPRQPIPRAPSATRAQEDGVHVDA
jgi:DUF1365 family protein